MTIMMERPSELESRTDSVQVRRAEPFQRVPSILAIALGAATATSVALGMTGTFELVTSQGTGISSAIGSAAPVRVPLVLTTDALVRRVREASGLTWDQIARVFGVSRRAVHHWAVGESMSAHNLELLSRFDRLVHKTQGSSPEETRAALFAADEDGLSPLDAFRQMVATSGVLANPRVASHEALLGAE